jgi:hypothetical protein
MNSAAPPRKKVASPGGKTRTGRECFPGDSRGKKYRGRDVTSTFGKQFAAARPLVAVKLALDRWEWNRLLRRLEGSAGA